MEFICLLSIIFVHYGVQEIVKIFQNFCLLLWERLEVKIFNQAITVKYAIQVNSAIFFFFHIIQVEGNDKYVDSGPPFLIFLHPALGPLWEVTRQKVSVFDLVIFAVNAFFPLLS